MDIINSLLEKREERLAFAFWRTVDNQIKNLKIATEHIPNTAGLYLVFCEKRSTEASEHLVYTINNREYILCYFGKAGGTTKEGKILKQGLSGRINNVISDSFLYLKDIKRAKYWNIIMQSNKIDFFYVQCFLIDEPQEIEDRIYYELDSNNLTYPLMNKKRGKKST